MKRAIAHQQQSNEIILSDPENSKYD